MGRTCKRCGGVTRRLEDRFCCRCAMVVMREMERSGYLQYVDMSGYWSDERGRKWSHGVKVGGPV